MKKFSILNEFFGFGTEKREKIYKLKQDISNL